MDALVDTSRLVDGKPTSLRDLGYVHVGLDGGWNKCFAENHTFHRADGTPVWNERFTAWLGPEFGDEGEQAKHIQKAGGGKRLHMS